MKVRLLNRLELKAGQLEHDPVARRHLVETIENGVAYVAAYQHRPLTRGEHRAGQRRGRGLAVGARDSDHRARAQAEEQVDLTRHPDAEPACVVEKLRIPGHARTRVDDVDIDKNRVVIAPKPQVDARRQLRDRVAELGFALLVNDAHRLTLRGEISGQRDAAARRAHHEGGHVISRATPAAASAETRPAPQKVSAMRFSDQPWWWNV